VVQELQIGGTRGQGARKLMEGNLKIDIALPCSERSLPSAPPPPLTGRAPLSGQHFNETAGTANVSRMAVPPRFDPKILIDCVGNSRGPRLVWSAVLA
jgi:hypothetical protein